MHHVALHTEMEWLVSYTLFHVSGNTTNMNSHLRTEHKNEMMPMNQSHSATGKSKEQPKVASYFTAAPAFSKDKQNQIDDVLMKLLVKKCLPLSLVDHELFRELLGLLEPR